MRSDMKKVLTERPRAGGRCKSPKGDRRQWQRCSPEDYPKGEKIRVKWISSYRGKVFTDVLGPLYRFLHRQVGRKWDTVYGEIARNLPKTSLQNLHVYTHLWQFVIKDVRVVDGVPCFQGGYRDGQPILSFGRRAQLYVHPGTGLLCKAKQGDRRYRYGVPAEPLVPGIKVYPGVQYHKVHGVWYEVQVQKYRDELSTGQPVPAYLGYHIKDDVLGRTYDSLEQLMMVYGGRYLAVGKRPLRKREIKFAGLK